MISDVPSSDDFRQSGIAFLNLAWDSASELTAFYGDAQEIWRDEGSDVSDEYWTSAQRPLATAVSLIQQGFEFLIKARIAQVSPYFLIAGSPSDWPKQSSSRDTSFSEFRTIDAQDLVRVVNTVYSPHLDEKLVTKFNHLRRIRNTIMHTIDRRMRFTAIDIFRDILEISHGLVGERAWVRLRRLFLESNPESIAYSSDHVTVLMARDFIPLIETFGAAEVRKFFGINKKQRRYFCPDCQYECRDSGVDATSAYLRPNLPNSTSIHCFLCDKSYKVERSDCPEVGCSGNVLDADERKCLTCSSNVNL